MKAKDLCIGDKFVENEQKFFPKSSRNGTLVFEVKKIQKKNTTLEILGMIIAAPIRVDDCSPENLWLGDYDIGNESWSLDYDEEDEIVRDS